MATLNGEVIEARAWELFVARSVRRDNIAQKSSGAIKAEVEDCLDTAELFAATARE